MVHHVLAAFLAVMVVVQWATPITALQNGLGLRPGMGWNWDYCVGCEHPPGLAKGFNETFIWHIARYLNTSGLQAKGYECIGLHRDRVDSVCLYSQVEPHVKGRAKTDKIIAPWLPIRRVHGACFSCQQRGGTLNEYSDAVARCSAVPQ